MGRSKAFTEEDIHLIESEYQDLVNNLTRCDKPEDRSLIKKAYKLAHEAHYNMRRKSGEPYILHPISVAKIVNQEIGLGAKSITCALLHDVVEDTDYTLEDIQKQFGGKVAQIIDGLTKISHVYDKNASASLQAENFRKILLTLSDDVRVILIKLADRLHNMRTLDSLPPNKQLKIAGETSYLYAPMAHRLGLYAIKTELEDLSLKYHHPKVYEEISRKIKDNERRRIAMINKFSLPIIEKLIEHDIDFQISGRPKSIFSIWKKMQLKHIPFEEVYDLLAVRIVFEPRQGVPEKTQCWNIYSIITDNYMPKPDRLRDWVSTPKANGYEALHVTVMGPQGKWVEVQIRSTRMDEIAERGFAAHWKYKGDSSNESELDKWIKRIREMLENPQSDALEFLDEFKMNLFSSEILVFTPKGHIITLPKGASALDFAYEIHTEIGNKAIGAKVNYKLLPINHALQSGDQVEILTSDVQQPEANWLDYVVTAKGKSAVKHALKAASKDRIRKGQFIFENKLKELEIKPSQDVFNKLLPTYDVLTKDELYSKIGMGIINLDDLKKTLKRNPRSRLMKYWELRLAQSNWKKKSEEDSGEENAEDARADAGRKPSDPRIDVKQPYYLSETIDEPTDYEIAKCCKPIPGDEVIGYLSPNNTIIIHKPACPVASRLMTSEGNRIIAAKWTTHKLMSFLARIEITGIDRIGLMNDITAVISKELSVNMTRVDIRVNNGIMSGQLDLYVHNTQDINNLIMNLVKIKGIDNVQRVESLSEE